MVGWLALERRYEARRLLVGVLLQGEVREVVIALYMIKVLGVGERSSRWFSDETLTYRRVHKHNVLKWVTSAPEELSGQGSGLATGEAQALNNHWLQRFPAVKDPSVDSWAGRSDEPRTEVKLRRRDGGTRVRVEVK